MENKNHKVCAHTGIIVNDGVTLFPGYCEVKDGVLYRYASKDPLNEEAKRKPWILHNRVSYQYVAESEPCTDEKLQGKVFLSKRALRAYLTKDQ